MRPTGYQSRLRILQGIVLATSGALVLIVMAMTRVEAQQPFPTAPVPISGAPYVNPGLGNYGPMRLPPRGFWCQVIMANARWVVVQDEERKQYPISAQAINQFLVRWPTNLDQVTVSSLVEASGVDVNTNTVRTDHIDIFESDAYALATPTVMANYGFNSLVNPASLGLANAFGGVNPIVNPIVTGELSQPTLRTVVGQAVTTSPLRLSLGGNNYATILPVNDAGVSMTRVTLGTTAFATVGDVVFISPIAMNTKSLAAGQLVLYKRISHGQFVPATTR